MKSLYTILVSLFLFLQISYGQISDKIDIFISGGTAIPAESNIGNDLQFPQLNIYTTGNFARDILGLKQSSSNFETFWDIGIALNGGIEYKINKIFTVRGEFLYNNYIFNKNELEKRFNKAFIESLNSPFNSNGLEILEGSTNIYSILLNLKVGFPLKFFTPYINLGGGYIWLLQEPIDINYYDEPSSQQSGNISFYDQVPSYSENAFSMNAAGGLMYNLSNNIKPFVEGNYVSGLTKNNNTIFYSFRFGFNFSFQQN
jgi:opacity protein-like surface antigen